MEDSRGVATVSAVGTILAQPPPQTTAVVVQQTTYYVSDGVYYEQVYTGIRWCTRSSLHRYQAESFSTQVRSRWLNTAGNDRTFDNNRLVQRRPRCGGDHIAFRSACVFRCHRAGI